MPKISAEPTVTTMAGTDIFLVNANGITSTISKRNLAIGDGVYNVKDYGAVGDGTTDDRVAIQAAIDTCSTAGGGIVYAPLGTYIVSLTAHPDAGSVYYGLRIPSNIVLMGAGMGATIFKLQASEPQSGSIFGPAHFDPANPINRVVLRDFIVDGNAANQSGTPAGNNGINVFRMRYVALTRIEVRNIYGTAGSGSAESFAFNCVESSDVTHTDCRAIRTSGNTAAGFCGSGSNNLRYEQCEASYLGTGVSGAGNGFTFNGCSNLVLSNCHSYLNNYYGFNFEVSQRIGLMNCIAGGKSCSDAYNPIAANTELGNGNSGICVNGCSDLTIQGGASRNSAGNGLLIANACDQISIAGLDLVGNTTPITFVTATVTNLTITNCPGAGNISNYENYTIDIGGMPAAGTLTLTNNSTAGLFGSGTHFSGMLLMTETATSGATGVFVFGATQSALVSQIPANIYSVTKDSASKINVYEESNSIVIQNKYGSTVVLQVMSFRTRASA